MNKFLISAGLVAISSTTVQAVLESGLSTMEKAKPWSLSASLRGFYDDNYTTGSGAAERSSVGFEVSPSASLNIPLQQSFIGASYVYSMRYYDDRADNEADHTHQFNAKLDHAFSERYKVELSESFVIAQEPQIIDPDIATVPLRVEGDNIRNTASVDFTAQLTQLLGIQLGYENLFYDYEQRGIASRSAILDRMEHQGTLNLRWQLLRQTVGIVGYQFGVVEFTSDDPLTFTGILPEIRDKRYHRFYVGADQNFSSRLNGSVRLGGEIADYFNDPSSDTAVGPYADASLTYSYATGSYLQSGLRHSRNQTDIISPLAGSVTQDQESTAFYVSLVHQITPKISANALGQFQHSVFEGGSIDDGDEQFFSAGLNLAYRINPHWLAETGYNYWLLNSDVPDRDYNRNYVYLGARATF